MLVKAVIAAALLTVSATVSAQTETCAETFPARLADAKGALREYAVHEAEFQKARPALEWFDAHCRFLSELEIAIRKLDEINPFVCEPKAKGRPKGLTSELVLTFSAPPSVGTFQDAKAFGENHRCAARDPVSLVFGEVSIDEMLHRMEVLCWDDTREKCIKARETIAAERAKAKQAGM
jgi:hypothetical protein